MSDFNSLFDSDFCIDKPIRLIELFGGIGSQAMALCDIGADFEHYRLVEFDKYAVASYNAIHGTSFEPTDIRNVHGGDLGIVDKDRFCYLLTYSFPCQSLSVAGRMEGMSKADWESGKSTRSGLLWEVERILKELPKECLPDILLMENVPQVHAEKNLADFESWQKYLRGRGYQNFWTDLNARDFGIPQNRNRCFMVSILSDEYVDFEFPEKIELEKVMKDYLEEFVDEKYYINSEKADKLIKQLVDSGVLDSKKKNSDNREQRTENRENCTRLICASSDREKSQSQTQSLQDTTQESKTYSQQSAVLLKGMVSENFEPSAEFTDVACTIKARDWKGLSIYGTNGGNRMEVIEESKRQKSIRAKVLKNGNIRFFQDDERKSAVSEMQLQSGDGVAQAITTLGNAKIIEYAKTTRGTDVVSTIRASYYKTGERNIRENIVGGKGYEGVIEEYRIRKLTPREVWRLMGYTDEDFDKAAAVNSNTQLYKEAGNAIVKQVLMAIFRQMKPKMREQK